MEVLLRTELLAAGQFCLGPSQTNKNVEQTVRSTALVIFAKPENRIFQPFMSLNKTRLCPISRSSATKLVQPPIYVMNTPRQRTVKHVESSKWDCKIRLTVSFDKRKALKRVDTAIDTEFRDRP